MRGYTNYYVTVTVYRGSIVDFVESWMRRAESSGYTVLPGPVHVRDLDSYERLTISSKPGMTERPVRMLMLSGVIEDPNAGAHGCDKLTLHGDGKPHPCPNHDVVPGEPCPFVHVDKFGNRIYEGRLH